MRKFDLSLRSSRSSYFATFRHQLTILSKTDALDEEKWLNMLGTFVKDWFRYESHFVHGRDSLVDILKERGLLSESDAVQPLIEVCKLLMLICILTKNVITSCSVTMMLFLHLEVKPLMTLTTVLYLSCALISGHLAMMLMELTKRR